MGYQAFLRHRVDAAVADAERAAEYIAELRTWNGDDVELDRRMEGTLGMQQARLALAIAGLRMNLWRSMPRAPR